MATLDEGFVKLALDGREYILKPTLDAAMTLSNIQGGLSGAAAAVSSQNLVAMTQVIQAGASLPDSEFKAIQVRIWKAGTAKIWPDVYHFIQNLQAGGRDARAIEPSAEAGEGNA